MENVLSTDGAITEQNRRISETLAREQSRLRRFIHQRVPDVGDAEDIFQEVFYELVDAYRLMNPLEQIAISLSAMSDRRSLRVLGLRHHPNGRARLPTTFVRVSNTT